MLRLAIKDIPDISVRGARILGRRMDVYVGLKTPDEEKEGKVVSMLK